MVELLMEETPALPALALLLLAKFLFSVVSFGSGAPGGIFFPMLVLGSYLGAIFGSVVIPLLGLPADRMDKFIILAMAGIFASIVRAPITGIVLIAEMTGSEANDPFYYDEAGRVRTKTNHSGGIQGGITNGMPLVLRTAVKPTASIFRPQQTVDLAAGQDATLALKGRHDPAIVHRARAVVDAVVAFGLVDLAAGRYGTDWMAAGFSGQKRIFEQ